MQKTKERCADPETPTPNFTARVPANREERKPILLKYTDQRNNLESMRCANISLFREMNLDMLIHVRCVQGHS